MRPEVLRLALPDQLEYVVTRTPRDRATLVKHAVGAEFGEQPESPQQLRRVDVADAEPRLTVTGAAGDDVAGVGTAERVAAVLIVVGEAGHCCRVGGEAASVAARLDDAPAGSRSRGRAGRVRGGT
jgi:hypothetical protein